jgi:hypothetical protein
MILSEVVNSIIIPIICSILTGSITFTGVLLTIHHENKKYKLIQQESLRPLFCVKEEDENQKNPELVFSKPGIKDVYYRVPVVILNNTDHSVFKIKKIIVNSEEYKPQRNKVVLKNEIIQLIVESSINKIESFQIIVLDIYDNEYLYEGIIEEGNVVDVVLKPTFV